MSSTNNYNFILKKILDSIIKVEKRLEQLEAMFEKIMDESNDSDSEVSEN